MKKIIGLFAAAALAFGVIGCTNDDLDDGEYLTRDAADEGTTGNYSDLQVIKSFTVKDVDNTVSSVSVDKGSSKDLTLSAADCTVKIVDSNIATATINDKTLTIKGEKVGSTTVYVLYSGNIAASIDVTVVSTGVVSAQATFSGLATDPVNLTATLTDDDGLLTSASDLKYSVETCFGTVDTSITSSDKPVTGYNSSVIGGSAGYKITGLKDNSAISKGDLLGYFYTTITAKENVKIDSVSFTIGSSSFTVTGKVMVGDDVDNIDNYTSSTSSTSAKASTGTISDIGVSIAAGKSKVVAVAVYADNSKKAAAGINFGISSLDVKVVESDDTTDGGDDDSDADTTYTVVYNGTTLTTLTESEFAEYADELTADTDYTISGTTITLTEAGYKKVMGSDGSDGDDDTGDNDTGDDASGDSSSSDGTGDSSTSGE